jgi:hypothetical protein
MGSEVANKWLGELRSLSIDDLKDREMQAKSVAENATLREVIMQLEQENRILRQQTGVMSTIREDERKASNEQLAMAQEEASAARSLLKVITDMIDENEKKDDPEIHILGIRNILMTTLGSMDLAKVAGLDRLNLGSLSKLISQSKQELE